MKVYVASKVKHAELWKRLRKAMCISATWIDEAGEGHTADRSELAVRCLREVSEASALVLYCQPGDILRGALLEAGAALALGIQVYCVGDCESLSRIFCNHPLWHSCLSLHDATEFIQNAESKRVRP